MKRVSDGHFVLQGGDSLVGATGLPSCLLFKSHRKKSSRYLHRTADRTVTDQNRYMTESMNAVIYYWRDLALAPASV